jgi:3D (Asp-Asp-Asp) domain-containing protein
MQKLVATSGVRSAAEYLGRRAVARRMLVMGMWGGMTAVVVWSAILAKTSQHGPAPVLAELRIEPVLSTSPLGLADLPEAGEHSRTLLSVSAPSATSVRPGAMRAEPVAGAMGPAFPAEVAKQRALSDSQGSEPEYPADVRWFDGQPVRVAREVWMTVTAYSPDAASCGLSADGITATLHHVTTNGFKLVAADPKVLPYGSMITVPGYGESQIVPVLDCGGAIKGHRLDVLFPTHEQAREWGVKKLKVTVWEFVDGSPRVNPRAAR